MWIISFLFLVVGGEFKHAETIPKGSCKKLLILANISAKALKAVKITDLYSIILVLAVKAVKYPVKHVRLYGTDYKKY